jgi:hypothetical protein
MPDYVIFKEQPSGDWRRMKTESAVDAETAIETFLSYRLVPKAGSYLAIEDNFWPPYDVTVETNVTVDTVLPDPADEPADDDADEH